MEFFLCGGGFGKQVRVIFNKYIGNIGNVHILYIPLAMEYSEYSSCERWFKDELKGYNANFYMLKSNRKLETININEFSHIFIGGGNTYKLLKEIKEVNFFEMLKNFEGKIWGGSAGAIIFGKDINSCKLEDENIVNLKDTMGLNIANGYSILCHLNDSKFEKNKKYLKEYSKEYKTIFLPEENVIYIKNNEYKVLGNKKYVIFENGSYNEVMTNRN